MTGVQTCALPISLTCFFACSRTLVRNSILTRNSKGLTKHFSKFDKFDYFWPEFQHIGEQEIFNKEILANHVASEKRKKDAEEAYRNQVEAIRAMEDESINLISNDYERETAKLRTEHRRQIEDLREKLRTEKNLNKTAREAINRQINMLDTAFQRAQLQLIQKHNQEEEAANKERTQRLLIVTGKDRKSTRLNSSHRSLSRMPSSA